jgi:hypothetical protein
VTAKLRVEVATLKRKRVPLAVTLAKMSTRDMAASAMPEGLRERVMGAELDAAVALGCLVKMGKKHQATLKKLSMAQGDLDKALGKVQPQTDWIEKCGKKGQRYDIFVVELGLQLVSQNMNAEQCAYAFAVFMKMSYPEAKVDVDYRVPTTTVFKEWAELLYPIGVAVNRSRLDLAAEIYYHHDDSPRGGYSWHGSIAQATFQETEGTHVKHTIPLGLEVLADGKHKTMAAEGVKIMGPNLRKMCMVMSDAAALDVAEHMYKAKDELLKELEGVAFTVREREVNDTNFVAQCINHGGDNASKAHFAEISRALQPMIVKYNCATLIQHWWATRLLVHRTKNYIAAYNRAVADSDDEGDAVPDPSPPTLTQFAWFFCRPDGATCALSMAECLSCSHPSFGRARNDALPPPGKRCLAHRQKVWRGLLRKVVTDCTGRARFHAPMELQSVVVNGEVEVKSWKLTAPVHDVWALMRSMSNLISHQGSHSKFDPPPLALTLALALTPTLTFSLALALALTLALSHPKHRYYLNEAKQMRLFWAKHELEHGVNDDTNAEVGLPAFANNRFGIRQELAFYLTVAWDSTMT